MEVILRRFPDCAMPTSGWSMRFTNLLTTLELLDEHQPQNIVEFGSGISTLMIAAWMQERGAGRLVSFDHDDQWASVTRRFLTRHRLTDFVEVVTAPLREAHGNDGTAAWYDLRQHAPMLEDIDFLLIDGPPAGTEEQRFARRPALYMLHRSLANSCIVVLDDANRPGETQIVQEWTKAHPEFSSRLVSSSTGLAILVRQMSAPKTCTAVSA
jgi:predicted O-methyltransferase YrrM